MTYLPGQAVVPCAICGTEINRRGAGGAGHRKFCSDACRRTDRLQHDRARRGSIPRRTDGVCPRCDERPRAVRSDGRLRGWCRQCESAQKGEYMRTDAGKAVWKRWWSKTRQRHQDTTCWWCAKTFPLRQGQPGKARHFCGRECGVAGGKHLAILRGTIDRRLTRR